MNSVKVNTQNSVSFLYTNCEQSENEVKTITFIKLSTGIKYLEVNLTKWHIYTLKTTKCYWKKFKVNTNKWEDILCSCIEILNIVKMSVVAKWSQIQY